MSFTRKAAPSFLPIDPAEAPATFRSLARQGERALAGAGREFSHQYFLTMRYRNQTHEVAVPIVALPLKRDASESLEDEFIRLYEATYGVGTALAGMAVEAVTYEVVTTARVPRRSLEGRLFGDGSRRDPRSDHALSESRPVVFAGEFEDTRIYQGDRLNPSNCVVGPAVIECLATTIVVHPGQTITLDQMHNFELAFSHG
jgi:N-methylhydantoinase A